VRHSHGGDCDQRRRDGAVRHMWKIRWAFFATRDWCSLPRYICSRRSRAFVQLLWKL
jgi:hypothetical protein